LISKKQQLNCVKGSSGPTIADICNWLAGGEEDNNRENEQELSTPPIIHTIRHDDATSAFNMCYKWAEENNVLTLKIARKSSKKHLETKDRTTDAFFFVKMQRNEALFSFFSQ
jgi:hypothetical protein